MDFSASVITRLLRSGPAITRRIDSSSSGMEMSDLQRRAAKRSEEHTSELQSQSNLVCRLLLEKKKKTKQLKAVSTMIPSRWALLRVFVTTHAPQPSRKSSLLCVSPLLSPDDRLQARCIRFRS